MQEHEKATSPYAIPWAEIKDGQIIAEVGTTVRIPLSLIVPNKDQPRKFFDPEELKATALSYEHRGDAEKALDVTLRDENRHVLIVDGGSRYFAAQIAKLEGISCYIKPPMTDNEVYLSSAVANIRRRDFSVVEKALALEEIMERFNLNQTEAGSRLGMAPSQVTYHLKFLNLTAEIHLLLMHEKIGTGIAFQLAKFKQEDQKRMLEAIRAEVKKRDGKAIHPNEAARILRAESGKRNIAPQQGSRGRSSMPHAQLVGRHVTQKVNQLSKALKELKELTLTDLQTLTDPTAIDLETDLLNLQRQLAISLKQFDRIT